METKKYDERDYCRIGQICLDYGFNYSASLCYVKALDINPNSIDANAGLAKVIFLEIGKARTEGRIR